MKIHDFYLVLDVESKLPKRFLDKDCTEDKGIKTILERKIESARIEKVQWNPMCVSRVNFLI